MDQLVVKIKTSKTSAPHALRHMEYVYIH
jgi:hypothetical protein